MCKEVPESLFIRQELLPVTEIMAFRKFHLSYVAMDVVRDRIIKEGWTSTKC